MVRRLVEKQQVGLGHERRFKNAATAPSTRERVERRVVRTVGGNLLRNVDCLEPWRADDLAAIRFETARYHFHESGLPLAVPPRKRGAQPSRNRKGHAVQNGRSAEREGYVLER